MRLHRSCSGSGRATRAKDMRGTVACGASRGVFVALRVGLRRVGANGSGCLGLHTLALFEGTANSQSLAAFDQKYVFTSVGALSNEAVMYLSRYDIADFGIPRGNVQSSLGNFLYIAEQFSAEVGASSQTVSLEGFADDMSASALNAAGARKLGASMAAGDTAALHRAEIAATPELVRTLSKIGGARLNKIANGK